jgi:hypothetical protein
MKYLKNYFHGKSFALLFSIVGDFSQTHLVTPADILVRMSPVFDFFVAVSKFGRKSLRNKALTSQL